MSRFGSSSWSHAILIAALSLLPGCGDLFPWHEPTVRVYVSDPVEQCPAADSACALLSPLAADSQLLAQLARDTVIKKARLSTATNMSWTESRARDYELHLKFPPPPKGQKSSIYVLELMRSGTAHDSVLSIASNGGSLVWLNGLFLGASRSARRAARRHQDIYTAELRRGTNVLLYRVLNNGGEAQFHREWHPQTSLPDLLAASIDLGAYTTLAKTPLLADSATVIELSPPQIRLRNGPIVHFSWRTLLGDSLADGGRYVGAYPESLRLPARFHGEGVLRTEVFTYPRGRRVYLEESPIFADSTARRLARALAIDTTTKDPVRAARVDAVRAIFRLGPVQRGGDPGPWLKVWALASLYRHIRQPAGFARYIGPQVWGYRASDGTVQPYWLTVPPSAAEAPARPAGERPGLVLSVTHFINPDFWAGRGRAGGFLVRLAVMSSSYGTFGVMPQLGGVHDFDTIAVKELPAIARQVDSVFAIDTSAVGILAWSSHALEAVQMAHDPRVPIAWLGLAVPEMYHDQRELDRAVDSLYRIRPRLHWLVWQAEEDTVIRREETEAWVNQVRRKGFDVRYRVVPYSTHLGGYFEDIEAELHRSIAFRFRGASGRALRDSLTTGTTHP